MMPDTTLIKGILIIIMLILLSYIDIRDRKLPLNLMKLISVVTILLLIFDIGRIALGIYSIHYLISVLITIAIYAGLHYLNYKTKKTYIGAADLLIFALVSFEYPFFGVVPVCIILLPAAFVLSTFAGFIPQIAKIHQQKIPFIPYMAIVFTAGFVLTSIL